MVKMPKIHYAWLIMLTCCMIMFTGLGVLVNSVGLFFVPVCNELGFTRAEISFYVTVMNIAMVIALPFAGWIFPKINIKVTLSLALGISGVSFALMSQFHTLSQWYINGAVRGVCNAFIMYMPVPLLINNWFRKKRGTAMGIAFAFSGLGGAIGNPLGNFIIANYGWRMGYIVLGVLCVVISLPFILLIVKYQPSDKGLRPYGDDGSEKVSAADIRPVMDGFTSRQALKSVSFYIMFMFAGLVSLAAYLSPQLPGYAKSIGYDSYTGAYMVSWVMLGAIIGKIGLGYINDKFGAITSCIFGCICGGIGMVLLFIGKPSVFMLYSGSLIYGIGFAVATMEPPILVEKIFGQRDFSAIFSYVTVGTALIGGFGTYVFGYIFDVTASFDNAIILCLVTYIIAAFLAVFALKSAKAVAK